MAFYRTYKPEYATASQVSTILAKYKGRERTLATMLARKYGPALVAAAQPAVRLEVARPPAPQARAGVPRGPCSGGTPGTP